MSSLSVDRMERMVLLCEFIDEYLRYGTHTPFDPDFETYSAELSEREFVQLLSDKWCQDPIPLREILDLYSKSEPPAVQ